MSIDQTTITRGGRPPLFPSAIELESVAEVQRIAGAYLELYERSTELNSDRARSLLGYLNYLPPAQKYMTLVERTDFFDEIVKYFPDHARKMIITFPKLFSLVESSDYGGTAHQNLFKMAFSPTRYKEQAYKLALHTRSVRAFLFFCDVFSEPGAALQIFKSGRYLSDDDLSYAMRMNGERANIVVLRKIFSEAKRARVLCSEFIFEYRDWLLRLNDEVGLDSLQSFLVTHPSYAEISASQGDARAVTTLDQLSTYLGLEVSEVRDKAISDEDPQTFVLLARILAKASLNHHHKLIMDRLAKFPDSYAASIRLLELLWNAHRPVLAMQLCEKIISRYPDKNDILFKSMVYRVRLGDWDKFTENVKEYLKLRKHLPSDRVVYSQKYMFLIDACPNISFCEKTVIYSDTSETKSLRRLTYSKTIKKKAEVAIFTGDFRSHVMRPVVSLIADSLQKNGLEYVIFDTSMPWSRDDRTIQMNKGYPVIDCHDVLDRDDFLQRYGFYNTALDLSQYTEFNRLDLFRAGIAKNQLSGFWASGFVTALKEIDFMLVDDYSFAELSATPHAKLVRLPHGLVLPPVTPMKYVPEVGNKVTLGVFFRPIRYSNQLFSLISKLIERGLVDKVLFSHPSYASSETVSYVASHISRHQLTSRNCEFSSNPLAQDINNVHVAIDAFPVGSPSVTRDLLHSGLPVFVFSGDDVFSRLSPSFLASLDLVDLVWHDEQALFEKFESFQKDMSRFLPNISAEVLLDRNSVFSKHLADKVTTLLRG